MKNTRQHYHEDADETSAARRRLSLRVRAGFVAQGTSLAAHCRDLGVLRQNAERALRGDWTGRGASLLIAWLVQASEENGMSKPQVYEMSVSVMGLLGESGLTVEECVAVLTLVDKALKASVGQLSLTQILESARLNLEDN